MNKYDVAAARRGAALLDKEMPGWHARIDLGFLNLASTSLCVLGQLFDEPQMITVTEMDGEKYEVCDANFSLGVNVLRLDGQGVVKHGFDTGYFTSYQGLEDAWKQQVCIRQQRDI